MLYGIETIAALNTISIDLDNKWGRAPGRIELWFTKKRALSITRACELPPESDRENK